MANTSRSSGPPRSAALSRMRSGRQQKSMLLPSARCRPPRRPPVSERCAPANTPRPKLFLQMSSAWLLRRATLGRKLVLGDRIMKFLHTADWQVGMRATQLGEKGERVRHSRLESARRVIEEARREKVDLMVVAGDTFENNGVDRIKVREVVKILGAAGCPVYLIPGNHDPLTPGSVWEDAAWGEFPNLHVLKTPEPVEVGSAILYPCPVCAGDSRED